MHWVEVLADYTANSIYKPGHIHSEPDALLCIPALNTLSNTDVLHEAICRAKPTSKD